MTHCAPTTKVQYKTFYWGRMVRVRIVQFIKCIYFPESVIEDKYIDEQVIAERRINGV
jgi:hypothetical protein